MSHFSVAVFHRPDQSVDSLLEPFLQEMDIDPRDKHSRERAIRIVRDNYDEYKNASDEECWDHILRENKPEKDGTICMFNPEGRIDWWTEGGRWEEKLKLHSGKRANTAKVKDIDFSSDPFIRKYAYDQWDVSFGKPVKTDEYISELNKDELVRVYHDKETYARSQAQFHTFAVITPDGEWQEESEMCLFGPSGNLKDSRKWNDNYKERFLDTADPEWMLTIVDCHI